MVLLTEGQTRGIKFTGSGGAGVSRDYRKVLRRVDGHALWGTVLYSSVAAWRADNSNLDGTLHI